jgi:hypothetical protein
MSIETTQRKDKADATEIPKLMRAAAIDRFGGPEAVTALHVIVAGTLTATTASRRLSGGICSPLRQARQFRRLCVDEDLVSLYRSPPWDGGYIDRALGRGERLPVIRSTDPIQSFRIG